MNKERLVSRSLNSYKEYTKFLPRVAEVALIIQNFILGNKIFKLTILKQNKGTDYSHQTLSFLIHISLQPEIESNEKREVV